MDLVNLVLKVFDKVERKGKKGRVERYVCGALIEMGMRKAMMKRRTSRILSRRVGFPFYCQSELPKIQAGAELTLAQDITL